MLLRIILICCRANSEILSYWHIQSQSLGAPSARYNIFKWIGACLPWRCGPWTTSSSVNGAQPVVEVRGSPEEYEDVAEERAPPILILHCL